jgi:hypothetical protein
MRIGRPVSARACISRANPVNATFVAINASLCQPLVGTSGLVNQDIEY